MSYSWKKTCVGTSRSFGTSVLAGIAGYFLVSPYVLPHRLTGNQCRDFLLHYLLNLLEGVPLAVRARMQYVHDGAPVHFSRSVRDVPSNTSHVWWIGRGEPTAWLPLSPDLNSIGFYLWGHLKTIVYAAPVDNEETLHHRYKCNWNIKVNYHEWRGVAKLAGGSPESHREHHLPVLHMTITLRVQ
jgi:hypothetical protein